MTESKPTAKNMEEMQFSIEINTTLTVAFDVPSDLEEYFKVNYPKALERVKILAERKKG